MDLECDNYLIVRAFEGHWQEKTTEKQTDKETQTEETQPQKNLHEKAQQIWRRERTTWKVKVVCKNNVEIESNDRMLGLEGRR